MTVDLVLTFIIVFKPTHSRMVRYFMMLQNTFLTWSLVCMVQAARDAAMERNKTTLNMAAAQNPQDMVDIYPSSNTTWKPCYTESIVKPDSITNLSMHSSITAIAALTEYRLDIRRGSIPEVEARRTALQDARGNNTANADLINKRRASLGYN